MNRPSLRCPCGRISPEVATSSPDMSYKMHGGYTTYKCMQIEREIVMSCGKVVFLVEHDSYCNVQRPGSHHCTRVETHGACLIPWRARPLCMNTHTLTKVVFPANDMMLDRVRYYFSRYP